MEVKRRLKAVRDRVSKNSKRIRPIGLCFVGFWYEGTGPTVAYGGGMEVKRRLKAVRDRVSKNSKRIRPIGLCFVGFW
ncbi:hypothetical protein GOBAR_AA24363 [Gossypium barbadense]|uniref:Uncharacterized protein n=1 Tax=Gossypium barbadense TaxID=3634 RepID=A0A2P5WYY9_GOSBA|nr:hypothetical protein GOBAR_AA24363 [Gossypium barbadense]